MARALVIGGGFAGLEAAIFLRREGVETTLLTERPYAWIYPISIWIPTGGLKPEGAQLDLAEAARVHGFELVVGRVQRIDTAARRVHTAEGSHAYEHLVIALGATKLRPPGVENTLSICAEPDQASRIGEALERLVARGGGQVAFGFAGNPKDPSAVRGGPVFELMFNVDHWLRRRKLRDRFVLTFFAPMAEPGKKMGPRALEVMGGFFARTGIQQRVGVPIQGFRHDGVDLTDGSAIAADLTVFVPGAAGLPLLREAGLPVNDAGFVRVDDQCRVPGHDGVWAIGDSAALEGPEWRAKQGHVAEVMARIAARDLALHARSGGRERLQEGYQVHVNILCLMDAGDGAAMVMRDRKVARVLLLPIVGHWLKRAWGLYWRLSKLRRIPRLPGM